MLTLLNHHQFEQIIGDWKNFPWKKFWVVQLLGSLTGQPVSILSIFPGPKVMHPIAIDAVSFEQNYQQQAANNVYQLHKLFPNTWNIKNPAKKKWNNLTALFIFSVRQRLLDWSTEIYRDPTLRTHLRRCEELDQVGSMNLGRLACFWQQRCFGRFPKMVSFPNNFHGFSC